MILSSGVSVFLTIRLIYGIYKNTGTIGVTSLSRRRKGLKNLSERGVGVEALMAIVNSYIK